MSVGYVFWCSQCRVSHAGECVTKCVASNDGLYPSAGSVWALEVMYGDVWELQGSRYRVIDFEAAVSQTVTVRCVNRISGDHSVPIAAWGQSGVFWHKISCLIRFVEIR